MHKFLLTDFNFLHHHQVLQPTKNQDTLNSMYDNSHKFPFPLRSPPFHLVLIAPCIDFREVFAVTQFTCQAFFNLHLHLELLCYSFNSMLRRSFATWNLSVSNSKESFLLRKFLAVSRMWSCISWRSFQLIKIWN